MATSELTLQTPHGPMPAFQATPDGKPKGAIIVIQEAFGVNDHIKSIANRLASAGYVAVAPAMFHRSGSPIIAYDDIASVMPEIGALNSEGITADLDATLEYLKGEGYSDSQVGIVGFCMGGTVALIAGALHPLGAAVTYYGGGVGTGRFGFPPLAELAPNLKAPWIGFFGDLDQSIPVDEVEQLRTTAKQAKVDTEVVRYADAEHGFHCDERPSYNAVASADAWPKTLAWFDSHIG